MAKQAVLAIKRAVWPPDRGIRELNRLLIELDELDVKNSRTGVDGEASWKQKSTNVFTRAFDSDSANHRNLMHARSAGSYTIYGEDDDEQNYRDRLKAYRIATSTAIADLEMSMPEQAAGLYEANDPFAFYNDLRDILDRAVRGIFVVDAYLDKSVFELYLGGVQKSIQLRALCNNPSQTTVVVAKLFANSHPNFELRIASLHDRVVFVDDRCWVVGQSLKDAAVKKPTYMVEVFADGMRTHYEPIWAAATSVAKS
jgi:hypothetical protein